jgi:hypothetical protein
VPWLGLFYPPAAAGAGLDLGRLFVVRPTSDEDQAWALDQVLRCRGVAAAWCCVEEQDGSSEGTVSIRQRRSIRQGGAAKARPTWRRWQLAAEASGVLGLFLRSAAARDEPCWADVRLLVEPVARQANADASRSRRSRVEVLRSRAAAAGGAVELNVELNLAARQDATQPERVTGPQERMASPQERMASSNVQRGKLPDETRAVHLASPLAAAKTGRRSRRA